MTDRIIVSTFDEYQAVAMKTAAIYPRTPVTWDCETVLETIPVYPAMAALGEAGELCEKIIDGGREQLPYLKKLGDVLWYITASTVELRLADPGHELWAAATRGGTLNDMRGWSLSTVSGMRVEIEALKLVAALGRYAERVKKCWRESTKLDTAACARDLSTALFQIHYIAMCFYSSIAAVAQANVDKLVDRRARGVLLGAGDNR